MDFLNFERATIKRIRTLTITENTAAVKKQKGNSVQENTSTSLTMNLVAYYVIMIAKQMNNYLLFCLK